MRGDRRSAQAVRAQPGCHGCRCGPRYAAIPGMSPRNVLVAVVDAGRARIYTYEPERAPVAGQGPELRERLDLIDPERTLRPGDRHGGKPGTAVGPTGRGYGLDDHRRDHEQELERRFAAAIV